jgi:uncharacterized protein
MRNLFTAPLLTAFMASMLAAQQPSIVDQPKITVSGEALVYAKPDKIILNLGIETHDTELLTAKRKNAEIWKKAVAAIKESGVPDKDVQTDFLSIEPRYKDYTQMDAPVGYVARNLFIVTLSDATKVEPLISKMLEIGVNHINGVEFQTTQFKQHRESARELALTAAREKAEKMAATLGCSIGKPVAINEMPGGAGGGSWYYSSWSSWGYGRSSSGMSQNVIQDTRGPGGGDSESMALGKISIRAGVSVVFELKDGRSDLKTP